MEEKEVVQNAQHSVNEEVVQQEEVVAAESVAPEAGVILPELNSEPVAQASKQQSSQEVNMRELRLSKERAEKESLELQQRLARYEQQEAKKEETPDYGDDDFIEGKQLKKEMASVRNQLKNYEKQAVSQADESRLKSRYTDFDKVVNADTIAKLRDEDPDFAETIAYSTSSLYARGSSTYKKIKDLGLYVEDKHEKDRALAQQNASKPRPLNSVSPQQGDSPLSMANAFANGLTPDLKKQLWKEMQDASKRS